MAGFEFIQVTRSSHVRAFFAVQRLPKMARPSEFAQDPGPAHKGRLMAYMLSVPARELSDPVSVFVLMKADDRLMHHLINRSSSIALFLRIRRRPIDGQECLEARRLEVYVGSRPRFLESLIDGRTVPLLLLHAQALRKTVQRPGIFRRAPEVFSKHAFGFVGMPMANNSLPNDSRTG
jgi:hypothetical protein